MHILLTSVLSFSMRANVYDAKRILLLLPLTSEGLSSKELFNRTDYQFQLYWNWELHICARYYKHSTQTRFSRTVKKGYTPETSCYYSHYETFDICDLRRENIHWWLSVFKRLSVYKPFVSTVRTAWSPVRWNSPFEWLPHPLVRNINPFERLSYVFVRNIKLFKRLGTRLLKTSGRSNGVVICIMAFLCIFCRMTCMGDELRYSLKKIPLFERSFKSMFSRFVWLHLHKFTGFKLLFCPF